MERKEDKRTAAKTKVCKDCGKRKPVAKFYLTSYAQKHGTKSRMPYCIPCYSDRGKAYYATHTEQMNARSRASVERRKREDPESFKRARLNTHLKNNYGITLAQWDEMFEAQSGLCAICRTALVLNEKGRQSFGVDHCHQTLLVRGLLCLNCNLAIGLFHEDASVLRRALDYIEGNVSKQRPFTRD